MSVHSIDPSPTPAAGAPGHDGPVRHLLEVIDEVRDAFRAKSSRATADGTAQARDHTGTVFDLVA